MNRRSLITPSYQQGLARSQGEAQHPGLWRGLVGAWAPALGASGATLYDVSGNRKDGALTNMDPATDWVVGQNGSALDIDKTGSADYITLPVPVSIDAGSDFSISILDDIDSYPAGNPGIMRSGVAGSGGTFTIWQSGNFRPWIRVNGVSILMPGSGVAAPTGNHMQSYVVKSGSWAGWYLDGVLSQEAAHATSTVQFDIYRLLMQSSAAEGPDGKFSYIYVHNRALSPNEITQLYMDPLAPFRIRDKRAFSGVIAPPGGFVPYPHPLLPNMQGGLAA